MSDDELRAAAFANYFDAFQKLLSQKIAESLGVAVTHWFAVNDAIPESRQRLWGVVLDREFGEHPPRIFHEGP